MHVYQFYIGKMCAKLTKISQNKKKRYTDDDRQPFSFRRGNVKPFQFSFFYSESSVGCIKGFQINSTFLYQNE